MKDTTNNSIVYFDKLIPQEEYDSMTEQSRFLTDDEAADIVAREMGFQRECITIAHEIPELELGIEDGKVRSTGKMLDRRPILFEGDWPYVIFTVKAGVTHSYEMNDDLLVPCWL